MSATEAKTLLQFLLDLLRDPQARAAFQANPQASLNAAGLNGMCFADVRDALPLVMDHAPASVAARYDDDVRAASASAVVVVGEGHHHGADHHWIPGPVLPPHTPEIDKVVEQLQYVTNHYSYDSHDTSFATHLDQNIRANGDVTTTLNQPVASGAGAVAAGGAISAPVATGAGSSAADNGATANGSGTAAFGAGNASSVGGSIGVDHGGAVSLQSTATGGADQSAVNFGSGAASSQGAATHTETPQTTVTQTDNSQTNSNNADSSQHTTTNSGAGDQTTTAPAASPLFAHEDAAHTATVDTLAASHDAQHHDVVGHG